MGCVYLVTNTINGKRYVGKTVISLARRRRQHECAAMRGSRVSPAFYAALRRYGLDAFTWIILFESKNNETLGLAEVLKIRVLGSKFPGGYNVTDGGPGAVGLKWTDSQRARIISANTGKKRSPEFKERMRQIAKADGRRPSAEALARSAEVRRGKPGPRLGVTITEETRRKLVESHLGKTTSPETRAKISEALLNSTAFQKAVRSKSRSEKISRSNTGKKRTPETRLKQSLKRMGKNLGMTHEEIYGEDRAEEIRMKKKKNWGNQYAKQHS